MPAKKRVFVARGADPGVQPDKGNCIRNALKLAGATQVDSTGTICIHPAPLLRWAKLLRGEPGVARRGRW